MGRHRALLHLSRGAAAMLAGMLAVPGHTASPVPVTAEHGMVVSAHHLASRAGVAVLKRGGNAVDAAVAVAYALAVTFPEAGNLGGGGFMTIRTHDGASHFIDFREMAPGAARADMYLDAKGQPAAALSTRGYLSAAIPGTVAGLEYARAKYGTRPRAELMAPAIALAAQGFVLSQGDADFLAEGADDFRKDGPSAAIFLNHGQPRLARTRLVQADLARSLRQIAQGGAPAFYQGPIARAITAASRAHGGIMTMADFKHFRADERPPITCTYRGYTIISAPPPSSGGVVLCEALGILEGYPMGALGFQSAQGTHYLIEALRRAYHDRNLNLGDPDFVHVDTGHFTDKAYAASLRAGISDTSATPSASLPGVAASAEGRNTTHFSIVDAAGNAVSLTYTLNDWFGARVTAAGTGILMNDEMDDFSSKPGAPNMYGLVEGPNNAIAPGKRPLSSMTPTIITRDGQLLMVVGTPGGSRIPSAVLQVVMNVIDYRMTVTEAVDAPRIHEQWLPDVTHYERFALGPDTIARLEAMGHKMEPVAYGNQIAAILVGAPAIGAQPLGKAALYGAIDPRIAVGDVEGY